MFFQQLKKDLRLQWTSHITTLLIDIDMEGRRHCDGCSVGHILFDL